METPVTTEFAPRGHHSSCHWGGAGVGQCQEGEKGIQLGKRGCVRTDNAEPTECCLTLLPLHTCVLSHQLPGLQSFPSLTEQVTLFTRKPSASWWYGSERTGALRRRHGKSVR